MELFITGYRSNKWNVGGVRPMTLAQALEACDIKQPPEYLYSKCPYAFIAVSSATTSTLIDDANKPLYYSLYALWDLVGVDDEGTRCGR